MFHEGVRFWWMTPPPSTLKPWSVGGIYVIQYRQIILPASNITTTTTTTATKTATKTCQSSTKKNWKQTFFFLGIYFVSNIINFFCCSFFDLTKSSLFKSIILAPPSKFRGFQPSRCSVNSLLCSQKGFNHVGIADWSRVPRIKKVENHRHNTTKENFRNLFKLKKEAFWSSFWILDFQKAWS